MQESIFIVYYIFLAIGLLIGVIRFKTFDKAMRIVVLWLSLIATTELLCFFLLKTEEHATKSLIFHCSSVLELICITAYFIQLVCPKRYFIKAMLLNIVLWPSLGLLNIAYLQATTQLNTNMLMLESFWIISMALYIIYRMLKDELIVNLFRNPHFWIWVLWLLLWSATFFFWAFIRVLYNSNWEHIDFVMNLQALINLFIYAGITCILLFYPKKYTHFEYT